MDGGSLKAASQFEINRTRWGVNYNSGSIFKRLGDKAIKDGIMYDVELVFGN